MKGGTNERTDERTDERTNESPPVFYRTSSPSGPLPKKVARQARKQKCYRYNFYRKGARKGCKNVGENGDGKEVGQQKM